MMIMQLFHKSTTDTHNFCSSQLSLIETILSPTFASLFIFPFECLPFIITVRPFDSSSSPFSPADDVVDGDLLLFSAAQKIYFSLLLLLLLTSYRRLSLLLWWFN